jgi:hypothetical protein
MSGFGLKYHRGSGGGKRRAVYLSSIGNSRHPVDNKYVVGAGVGATNAGVRRAKAIKANFNTATTQYTFRGLF